VFYNASGLGGCDLSCFQSQNVFFSLRGRFLSFNDNTYTIDIRLGVGDDNSIVKFTANVTDGKLTISGVERISTNWVHSVEEEAVASEV
jgi:hypothetical protein